MTVNVTFNTPMIPVTTGQFFQDLSEKPGLIWGNGFNKQIQIDLKTVPGKGLTYISQEATKPWKINPLRFFMEPQSPKRLKTTARHLVGLVTQEKANIVKDTSCNVGRIIAAFKRMRDGMAWSVGPITTDAQAIRTDFDNAIKALSDEYTDHLSKFYAKGRGAGFGPANASNPASFYKALSRTWFPVWFNERFQVIEPSKGQFEVHRMSKPWFFQKWVQWPKEINSLKFWKDMTPKPVPGASKIATAKKLEEMIKADKKLIRFMQPNTSGMISNLEYVKGRIVKNTTTAEKAQIEKAFDGAIKELRKIGMLTKKDWNRSWTGWTWNHTAVPFKDWVLVTGAQLTKYTASRAGELTWAGMKLPFQAINAAMAKMSK